MIGRKRSAICAAFPVYQVLFLQLNPSSNGMTLSLTLQQLYVQAS